MKRATLIGSAVTFFLWENVAMALWLRAHGGLGAGFAHAWVSLRQDWLVLLVLTDACVFTLSAWVWLWGDLRQRVASPGHRALWFAAAVVLGSPALLVYLAISAQPLEKV